MTVTLHLKPEVEAGLRAHADASGMMLEEYLLSVVEVAACATKNEIGAPAPIDRAEAVNKMLDFGEKHRLSFGAAITRGSLHEGHRF